MLRVNPFETEESKQRAIEVLYNFPIPEPTYNKKFGEYIKSYTYDNQAVFVQHLSQSQYCDLLKQCVTHYNRDKSYIKMGFESFSLSTSDVYCAVEFISFLNKVKNDFPQFIHEISYIQNVVVEHHKTIQKNHDLEQLYTTYGFIDISKFLLYFDINCIDTIDSLSFKNEEQLLHTWESNFVQYVKYNKNVDVYGIDLINDYLLIMSKMGYLIARLVAYQQWDYKYLGEIINILYQKKIEIQNRNVFPLGIERLSSLFSTYHNIVIKKYIEETGIYSNETFNAVKNYLEDVMMFEKTNAQYIPPHKKIRHFSNFIEIINFYNIINRNAEVQGYNSFSSFYSYFIKSTIEEVNFYNIHDDVLHPFTSMFLSEYGMFIASLSLTFKEHNTQMKHLASEFASFYNKYKQSNEFEKSDIEDVKTPKIPTAYIWE